MPTRSRGRVSQPQPVAGPKAFTDLKKREYVLSQAATLLLIGTQVRQDAPIRLRAPEKVSKAVPAPRSPRPIPFLQATWKRSGFRRSRLSPNASTATNC